MASGQVVGQILGILQPNANFATFDTRLGGSTPAEVVDVYDFDAGAIEYLDFKVLLSGYAGGGLTMVLPWSASSATSGATVWGAAVRRIADDAEDIDVSQTYDFNAVTDTAASASGELSYPTITFTDGADMDSWANGELAIVRIRRDATNGSDDMAGDAELWGLIIKES